ncbi:hypothetical protein HQ544_03880 [Candidatus Falkowbacteria bacterium]|nr:hypothetical protein [Candidatus Falkowbacteria bacterium]
MKKYAILTILILIPFLNACTQPPEITNFEECISAGNPAMESYPRQCMTEDGQSFTEEIEPLPEALTKQQAQEMARTWVEENSPTYKFDGSNLEFRDIVPMACRGCYAFVFGFTSKHIGYGDRSNEEELVEIETPHRIAVTIIGGEVANAVTDTEFNEIAGEMLPEEFIPPTD